MDSEELISAVRDGKLERVQELIGSTDLGSHSEMLNGANLLCDAIEAGHKDIITLLLGKGANVNMPCEEGFTRDPPLITAVHKHDIKIVQMLLDRGADTESKSQWGATSLCDAITLGNVDMVRLLLDNKANIYNRVFNYSALDHACKCEKPEIIELLVSRGAMVGKIFSFSDDDSSSEEDNRSYYDSSDDNSDDDEYYINPLYVAVRRGYVHLVEYCIRQGRNVNATCNLGRKMRYTPLHFACEKYKKQVLTVLLGYGADVNAKAEGNLTPLHIAVKKEKTEFVEMLLLCGADVNAEDRDGRTPLYFAVKNGDTRTVKTILMYGPDITADSNRNCLKAAICGRKEDDAEDIVRYLILYGFTSKTVNTDEEMVHEAVVKGYLHFVDDYLKDTDVNAAYTDTLTGSEGYTLLHTACEYNTIRMIKYLLLKGADINARSIIDLTPLHVAAINGHGQVVELLLEHGANIDDQDWSGNTALYFAAYSGCTFIVRYLLKCRPRINDKEGENPLCGAVMCNHKERKTIIEDLIRYGFTIFPKDADSYAFLCAAVIKGDLKIVKDLLKYILKEELPYYRDLKKRTPLHHAALNRRKEIVKLLIEHGADVNARDQEGATPMCSVLCGATRYIENNSLDEESDALRIVQRKCMGIIEILLRNGANPGIKGCRGKTVLHYTASCPAGMGQIAKLFLKKGVDVKIVSRDGSTPLSVATYKGNRELSMLFLEHGGIDFSNKMDRKALHFVNEMLGEEEYNQYFTVALGRHLVDIDAVDDRGATTLQFAFEGRYEELIRYLLEYGADINAGKQDWLDSLDYYYSESACVIKTHIFKLSTAGLKVPVETFLSLDYELLDSDGCVKEFKKLRGEKIADTTVCFHDILTADLDQLAAYAENESIVSSVKSTECEKLYPLYFSVIRGFLWRGIVRRGLLQRSIEIFQCCCLPELPDICVKKIFSYLTNQDLRVLIRSRQKST